MTAKGNTRQEILDAALELFSVQGFEATSISQLAEAVGIRKASLYSHFENKQAILDTLKFNEIFPRPSRRRSGCAWARCAISSTIPGSAGREKC